MPSSFGAIIICGGKSSRMGTSKAMLPFGPEALLQRIARLVREATVRPIVVVAAREHPLPELPSDLKIVFDEHEALGPLEGLRMGLGALRGSSHGDTRCEIAFAVSCDVPLLQPALVRYICESLATYSDAPAYDAAVPRSGGYLHPLAAAYRIDTVLPHVERLVVARRLRAMGLFDDIRTRIIDEAELRQVDPSLESLRNMNTPEDYEALLRLAGIQQRTTDHGQRTNL